MSLPADVEAFLSARVQETHAYDLIMEHGTEESKLNARYAMAVHALVEGEWVMYDRRTGDVLPKLHRGKS